MLLPAEVAVVVIRLAVVLNTRLLLSLNMSTVASNPIPNTALRMQVSPRAAVILPSSSGTTITPILRLSMAPTLLHPCPAPTTIPITLPKFTPILNMPNRLLTSQDTGLPSRNSMGNLTNILHHTVPPNNGLQAMINTLRTITVAAVAAADTATTEVARELPT